MLLINVIDAVDIVDVVDFVIDVNFVVFVDAVVTVVHNSYSPTIMCFVTLLCFCNHTFTHPHYKLYLLCCCV